MKKYIKFVENNTWEGETWIFYLELIGNEKGIKRLRKLLVENNLDDFKLGNEIDENEVEARSEMVVYLLENNLITKKI